MKFTPAILTAFKMSIKHLPLFIYLKFVQLKKPPGKHQKPEDPQEVGTGSVPI
jgi:hypothetical protein